MNVNSRRLYSVLTTWSSVMLLAALVAAQAPIPLTLENIYGESHGARQCAISPDGKWVAVTANGPNGNGIYLIPTGAKPAAEPGFWVQGSSAAWFPDSSRIVFSRANDLWTVAVTSHDPVRITNDAQDERAAVVSPDGKTLAFYSGRSGYQDIWLVPSAGGAAPRQLTNQSNVLDDARFAPAWSPNGREIAYVSSKNNYWHDDVWIVEVETGKSRQLSQGLMAMSVPVWSPDGRTIALLGTAKSGFWYEDLSDIYLLNPAGGGEHTVKMQVFATDSLHSLRLFWSADSSRIYFIYLEHADMNLWTVPAGGGVATRVTNLRGAMRSFDATAKADAFVFVHSTPTFGPEVGYITGAGGSVRYLTRFADTWVDVQEPEEVYYRSLDGLYIQGFLHYPPHMDPQQKYPALVYVHGGGTNSYLRTRSLMEQYLASKGYLVLAINYRGGSGFGRGFQDFVVNDWAVGQTQDAAAAADFLRSLPCASGKVGIYGYSYGGIMSMSTIARWPDRFDAAVPMAGTYDFADGALKKDRVGKIFLVTGHGGLPDARKEIYAKTNILAHMDKIRTPLLIMHGEADVRANFHQFELAVKTLQSLGKTFESKSYPNEPHGFRNAENRIDMYRRLEAFLDRYLKAGAISETGLR